MSTYCKECVLPNARPGIEINADGVCNACHNSKEKKSVINWQQRELDFCEVVKFAKQRSKGYDCVVPVSGGKDSTWQVIKCLEYGLTPLAVTWKTPARTEIGQKNLDNLIRLGVDHIDYQINPRVEKKFMYKSLVKYGTTALPMHMALFNIPLNIASKFDIPLVVWGENSAFEYGGDEVNTKGFELNEHWLKHFGVTHGTTAKDWISEDLTHKELTAYFGPKDYELRQKNIRAIFMGCYFPWDPKISLKSALEYGFRVREDGPKLGLYNYADIDDDFISIHHYIKWYKFGITRLFDNVSLEIRNGRMTRDEGVEIIHQYGEQRPNEDIQKLCAFLEITKEHFNEILETFRNRDIWKKDSGIWKIENFILSDWNWQ